VVSQTFWLGGVLDRLLRGAGYIFSYVEIDAWSMEIMERVIAVIGYLLVVAGLIAVYVHDVWRIKRRRQNGNSRLH